MGKITDWIKDKLKTVGESLESDGIEETGISLDASSTKELKAMNAQTKLDVEPVTYTNIADERTGFANRVSRNGRVKARKPQRVQHELPKEEITVETKRDGDSR